MEFDFIVNENAVSSNVYKGSIEPCCESLLKWKVEQRFRRVECGDFRCESLLKWKVEQLYAQANRPIFVL